MTSNIFDMNAGIARLYSEAAGAFALRLLQPHDMLALFREALAGDRRARMYMRAMAPFANRLGSRQSAPLCLTCDVRFHGSARPAFIGLFYALRDDPDDAIVFGICRRCDRHGVGRDAVIAALREVFPGLEGCDGVMAPEAGHA